MDNVGSFVFKETRKGDGWSRAGRERSFQGFGSLCDVVVVMLIFCTFHIICFFFM